MPLAGTGAVREHKDRAARAPPVRPVVQGGRAGRSIHVDRERGRLRQSVYRWCRWTGAARARIRRLIISTKIEKPIAK